MAKRFGDDVTEIDLIRDVYKATTYPMPAIRDIVKTFLDRARLYSEAGYSIRFYKLGRIPTVNPHLLTREGEARDD